LGYAARTRNTALKFSLYNDLETFLK